MKVGYSNRRIIFNMIFGILWLAIKGAQYFSDEPFRKSDYILLFIGVIYLFIALVEFFSPYFSYDSDGIITYSFFGMNAKKINFHDLIEVKYFGGTYTFRTLDRVIQISKSAMNVKHRSNFETFFQQVQLDFNNRGNNN